MNIIEKELLSISESKQSLSELQAQIKDSLMKHYGISDFFFNRIPRKGWIAFYSRGCEYGMQSMDIKGLERWFDEPIDSKNRFIKELDIKNPL